MFGADALALAKSRVGLQAKTYLYRLEIAFAGNRWGAGHCIDLPLLLGDAQSWHSAPIIGRASWADVDAKGRKLRAAWAAFAHSGNPHSHDGYNWQPFTSDKQTFTRLR
jgi:para-nitrobenzyl esterase